MILRYINEESKTPPKRKFPIQEPDTPPDFTKPENNQEQDPNQQDNSQDNTNTDNVDQNQNIQDNTITQDQSQEGEDQQQGDENQDQNMQDGQDPNQLESPLEQPPQDPLQQMEKEVFADLTPQQIEIKTKELKKNYQSLFEFLTVSIEKLNQSSRTSYDANLLDFLMRKLISLKELTNNAIVYTFDTRTYVSNKIELQRLILATNMVANLLNEVLEARIKRIQQYENKKKSSLEFDKNIDTQ